MSNERKTRQLTSIISWLESCYLFCQRAENEFLKDSAKSSVNQIQVVNQTTSELGAQNTDSDSELSEILTTLNLYHNRLRSKQNKAGFKTDKPKFSPYKPTEIAKSSSFSECPICKSKDHKLLDCKQFLMKSARDRYVIVRGFGICFHCLLGSHLIRECTNESDLKCGKGGCDKFHHALLHRDDSVSCSFEEYEAQCSSFPSLESVLSSNVESTVNHIVKEGGTSINLIVCSINAKDRLQRIPIITLLDGGANVTCIDSDLAERLKLPVILTDKKTVHYLNKASTVQSNEVEFELICQSDLSIVTLRGWTIKDLALQTGCVNWYNDRNKFEYLKDIPFPPLPKDWKISVLIGTNYPGLFTQIQQKTHPDYLCNPEFPIAVQYQLGWSIIGPNFKEDNMSNNRRKVSFNLTEA